MKNEAYLDGQKCAERLLGRSIVISRAWWEREMETYATGHFSTSAAREHFRQGWQSVSPIFVDGEHVTLTVRIMNAFPKPQQPKAGELSPLEKEMYKVFGCHNSMATITFVKETKVCLTYEVRSLVASLNHAPIVAFLRQHLVSYKVAEVKEG